MQHIAVAIDLNHQPELLLAHGLRLALAHRCHLSVVLVVAQESDQEAWCRLPGIPALLRRWGLISTAPTPGELLALGLHVKPIITHGDDVAQALMDTVKQLAPELLILGTHGRTGLDRLRRGSVAASLTRDWLGLTLVVGPHAALVLPEDSRVELDHVLIPASSVRDSHAAVRAVQRLLGEPAAANPRVSMLHVGQTATPPDFPVDTPATWRLERLQRLGQVVPTILDFASGASVDLIAMATSGPNSWLDNLVGTNTERVVQGASCPVLVVPVPD